MSRKERTTKVTFKSVICFIAAFVLFFNMVAMNAYTAYATEGDDDTEIVDENKSSEGEGEAQGSSTETTVESTIVSVPVTPVESTPAPEVVVTVDNDKISAQTTTVTDEPKQETTTEEGQQTQQTQQGQAQQTQQGQAQQGQQTQQEQQGQQTQQNQQTQQGQAQQTQQGQTQQEEQKPGALDGYTVLKDTYTYGSDNKSVVSILFYNDSDKEISGLEASDFDISDIDTDKYNVVYDPETGILAIAEKSTIVHQPGKITVADGTSAMIYYDFAETKDVYGLAKNTKVYFVPHEYTKVLDTTDALLGLPNGTAILNKVNSSETWGRADSEIDNISSYSGTQTNNVSVSQKGQNFDDCSGGTLFYFEKGKIDDSAYKYLEEYTSYWCNGGGVGLEDKAYGHAYVFEQKSVGINENTLVVSAKEDSELPIGLFTFKDSDVGNYVDLTLKFTDSKGNPREISIAGCTVSSDNNTVNYLKQDSTIKLKVAENTYVTLQLDTTGMEEKVWINNNQTIINQNIVTENDLAEIKKALSEGMVNIDIDGTEDEYIELKDKLAASVWQKNNSVAVNATDEDIHLYYEVVEANESYTENLSSNVKSHMQVDFDTTISNMETTINTLANNFVAKNGKDKENGTIFTDATAENTDIILAGKVEYNDLCVVVQNFIDNQFASANKNYAGAALKYGDFVARATLIKTVADNFVDEYTSVLVSEDDLEKTKYDATDLTNYQQILNGEAAWNKMTKEQRNYANKALAKVITNELTGETTVISFEKLLADAKAIRLSIIRNAELAAQTRVEYYDSEKEEEETTPILANLKVVPKNTTPMIMEVAEEDTKEKAPRIKKLVEIEEPETEEFDADDYANLYTLFEGTSKNKKTSITGISTQSFGLGSLIINVQTFLENLEDGTGTYLNSRGKNKSELQETEDQLSYSLENADSFARACLSNEELKGVNDGDTMEIRLRITPNEKEVSEVSNQQFDEAIEKAKENIQGLTKGKYIDISLEKRHNSEDWEYIPNTNNAIRIALDVPEEILKSDRKFYIMRNHDGECTLLEDLDDSEGTITFETDRFSDYLIMYDDNYAEAAFEVVSGVIENDALAVITTPEPINNMNGTVAAISFLFLLLIVALVAETTRREIRR